jgi:hypothetical protein
LGQGETVRQSKRKESTAQQSRAEKGRRVTDVPVVSEVTVALMPPALAQADYTVSHLYRIIKEDHTVE